MIGWFHMVFGLDMTIRALKPPLLTATKRRKRTTLAFVGAALVLSLATWLSTRIRPAGDRCFGDMIFRTIRSALLGTVFCAIMIPSFLVMALIIGFRLRKTVLMDHNERIAGTRMVYYLIEAAVLYIMILPFWIQAMMGTFDRNLSSSRIAEFMLFGWGSVICITHFILRANAARMAIRPSRTPWMKKRRFRLFGPNDLEIINISPPIIREAMELEPEDKYRNLRAGERNLVSPTDSSPDSSVVGSSVVGSPPKPLLRKNWPLLDDMERPPTPAKPGVSARRASLPGTRSKHKKQPSYSLFPGEDDLRLPPTVYNPDKSTQVTNNSTAVNAPGRAVPNLIPPVQPFASLDGSRDSTATLQIGMRFSSAPAAAAAAARPSTPPVATKRPSLLRAIDDMIRDTTSSQALTSNPPSGSPLAQQSTSTYYSSASPSEVSGVSSASSRRDLQSGGQWRGDEVTKTDEYAWLDLPSNESAAPTAASSVPTKTPANRVSGMYLTRSESLRRQAENNRLELANLERSGSGASRTQIRRAYPNPKTPDGSEVGTRGEEPRRFF